VFRAAQRQYGAPGGLAAAWSPVETVRLQPVPEARAAPPYPRPDASGELPRMGKRRTVGRVSTGLPIRPLAARLASSCPMTSPWPATAEHRPRESTSRCTRAASSLCRCATSRPPPRGERRWRGETERSQWMRTRARARVPFDRRCARPVVRRRSLEPALVHCSPHPRAGPPAPPEPEPEPQPQP
jgi:hypothetical protein